MAGYRSNLVSREPKNNNYATSPEVIFGHSQPRAEIEAETADNWQRLGVVIRPIVDRALRRLVDQ